MQDSISTYQDTLNYLYSLHASRHHNPIPVIRSLLQKIDNPHLSYKVIHITGTKGKGTVATQCAAVLRSAGYKVGLMTSPHLVDFCERFQVDFQYIPQSYVAENIPIIRNIIIENKGPLSFALMAYSLGFKYFRDQNCDWAVIEVGCGATHDYTNVVEPEISVITSIGLDHCHIFGNTYEDIALEKSGIIKFHKPCVVGPSCPTKEFLRKVAEEKEAEIYFVEKGDSYETFDQENSNITRQIFKALNQKEQIVRESDIEKGVRWRPPCRKQVINANGKTVILDVGHNPMALERLFADLNLSFAGKRIRVVFGMGKKRDDRELLEIVCRHASCLHLITANNELLFGYQELENTARSINAEIVSISGHISSVLPTAIEEMDQENEILLVVGSCFIMEGAKSALELIGAEVNLSLDREF
ncbi:unnamed protein product [Blepharisma stoltei]|uniref:Folylpolyglutamate synthase n=1 Tax=Blepharisma stoltei TaxID=1481888 RepID=A0AAU9J607_9CILI|nr:unnamed protein product [Blepharisma stoltei]